MTTRVVDVYVDVDGISDTLVGGWTYEDANFSVTILGAESSDSSTFSSEMAPAARISSVESPDAPTLSVDLPGVNAAIDTAIPMQSTATQGELATTLNLAVQTPMQTVEFTAFGDLDITEAIGLGAVFDPIRWGFTFSSTFTLAAAQTISVANHFVSRMGMASEMDIKLRGGIDLSDAIGMLDAEGISHVMSLTSTLGMGSTEALNHLKVLALFSGMSMEDALENNVNLSINLAAVMTLEGLAVYGQDLELTSTMDLAAMLESRYNAVIDAIDAMAMLSTQDLQHRMGMVFLSTLAMDSDMETQARLGMNFFDAMEGEVIFNLGEDVYQGWVFSTENAAFTEYSNYPFNSIVDYKGKPYGVADDGIYLLEGEDDAGEPIEAAVRSKLTSFRQRAIKDAKAAYIGYTSDGALVLKVSVVKQGVKHEHWFKAKYSGDTDFRTNRVTIPRGLRGTYWQFEIANVDGADFDIEDVTIMYEVMSRRIR